MNSHFGLLLILVASLGAVASASVDASIFAELLCKHPDKVVQGVTGVEQMIELANYFEESVAEKECRAKYLDSLLTLRQILTVSNDNVCSDSKISAIEEFNRKFVSTGRKDVKQQKKEHLKAPALVKAFYQHYAYLVSSKCKESLEQQLDRTSFGIVSENGEPVDMRPIDAILSQFQQSFVMDVENRGYKDLLLPWKLVDSLPSSRKVKKFLRAPVVDAEHPTPVRISIRVKGAKNLQSFQQTCLSLQRVYAPSILPVIRLVNLGLYKPNKVEPLEKIVSENESVRRMFGLAQLCETLMPVEAFEDETLKDGKVVTIKIERANELRAEQPPVEPVGSVAINTSVPAPSIQSLESVNELESMRDAKEAEKLIQALKQSRKIQEGVGKRMLHMTLNKMKSMFKSSPMTAEPEVLVEDSEVIDGAALSRAKRGLNEFSIYKKGTTEISFSKYLMVLGLSVVEIAMFAWKIIYEALMLSLAIIIGVIYFPPHFTVKLIKHLSG